MQAGKLRHRITFQALSEATTDAFGGQVQEWRDVKTVPAAVEPLKGSELLAAQAVHASATTRFTLRFIPGLNEAMRIIYAGKVFDVKDISDPDGRGRELAILADSGVTNG